MSDFHRCSPSWHQFHQFRTLKVNGIFRCVKEVGCFQVCIARLHIGIDVCHLSGQRYFRIAVIGFGSLHGRIESAKRPSTSDIIRCFHHESQSGNVAGRLSMWFSALAANANSITAVIKINFFSYSSLSFYFVCWCKGRNKKDMDGNRSRKKGCAFLEKRIKSLSASPCGTRWRYARLLFEDMREICFFIKSRTKPISATVLSVVMSRFWLRATYVFQRFRKHSDASHADR